MKRQDDDFGKIGKLVVAVWVAMAVFSLAFLGVIIWAIVKLVEYFT